MGRRNVGIGLALGAVGVAMGLFGIGAGDATSQTDGYWQTKVLPDEVAVGDLFYVHARYEDEGGIPSLTLMITDVDPDGDGQPNVELLSEPKKGIGSSFLSISHGWQLRALQPGTVTLRAYISYEKVVLCEDIPTPHEGIVCPVFTFNSSFEDIEVEIQPGPTPELTGDVNGDGVVGSIDAALILQYAAGLLPSLGGAETRD